MVGDKILAKILVSACLVGCEVRYDGGDLTVADSRFREVRDKHQLIPFCPEVSAGFPVPRAPAEITGGDGESVLDGHAKIIDTDKRDLTDQFIAGAHMALEKCQTEGIRFAILAEKSPSCGSNEIYDGSFSGTKVPGVGCTAALLRRHGISVFSQSEMGNLLEALKSVAPR